MGVQMNLIQFLKKTDECMDKMTKEQLAYFIHEQARNLNEEKREILHLIFMEDIMDRS